MEPLKIAQGKAGGYAETHIDVFGETRHVGRGERVRVNNAPVSGRQAQWSFCCDVNGVGVGSFQFFTYGPEFPCKRNLRICRAWHGSKLIGGDNRYDVAPCSQYFGCVVKTVDYPVDLWKPGVSYHGNFQDLPASL